MNGKVLAGEVVQLAGLIAIVIALVLGIHHWRFEVPVALGVAALIVGRRLRSL